MSINIRQKRFTTLVNQILHEELQKGNLPTSKEFGSRLGKLLREQDLAKPEYKFKRAKNGEVAESEFYNEAVRKIQKDLMILYENTFAVHDELKGKFNWFEVEKNKLEYEARKLDRLLEEKIHLYGKSGYITSLFDVFDDLTKVEEENNLSIDIKKHQVTLKEQENESFLIKPEAEIRFLNAKTASTTYKRIPISGNIKRIIEGNEDDTFQEVWLSKTQGPARGMIQFDFEKPQTINQIEVSVHTVKDVNIYIEFSLDEVNYYHLPYYPDGKETLNEASFHFPSTKMKHLRIWLEKSESDKEIVHPEGYQYQYLFGVKAVNFYQISYPSEGSLLTKMMEPPTSGPFSIGKVSLIVDEEIPDGTDIEYYVRAENKEDAWREISPINRENAVAPNIIDFKHVVRAKPTELGVAKESSDEEAEIIELRANGLKFYSIGTIEKRNIIPKTERLYIGKDAWNVIEMKSDKGDVHVPSLEDWKNPIDVKRFIVPIEDGNRGIIAREEVHEERVQRHYGIGMFNENRETVVSSIPSSTEPIAIFLNGEKLFEGIPNSRTRVNYRLKQGWNDITVLVYIQNLNTEVNIDIGFDPISSSTKCYASSDYLEKVSIFDLRYNVKNNDWSKYALYEKGDKIYVVVNHSLPGVSYDFYYDYVDENERKEIQLKAVLKQFSVGKYTTPVLKRYTIQFS